jgi:cellulose synthase (UDP-forming)
MEKNTATYATTSRMLEKHLTSPLTTLLLTLATIGALAYFGFLLEPSHRGNALPYVMALSAEFFIICHGLIAFWTILSGRFNPRDYSFYAAQRGLFGKDTRSRVEQSVSATTIRTLRRSSPRLHDKIVSIDVFIPVMREPLDLVSQTITAARDMYGKHTTYVLDDGESDDLQKLAARLRVKYIRRESHEHAKAGNVNNGLSKAKGEFFVIFDADFVADPRFLYETMPFFDDPTVAFVQTPQYYDNQSNFISTASGYMQHVFYSLVQAGKNRFNAAFCVGTNVVFRRSAVDAIGGMYRYSLSEDIWTSLLLHEKGFRSIYINKVLAVGKTPETIKAYSKQQLRWAVGSYEIFVQHNPLFSRNLTIDQRLQYFGTTAFYLNGFAGAVLLLLPILQIFFNLTPIAVSIPLWQWTLLYSGFYVTQIFLSIYTMGGFKLQTITLASATFPVYVKAFWTVIRGKKVGWEATGDKSFIDSPFNYIRVQVYLFILLFLTTVVGVWKSIYIDQFSISLAWCALNTFLLGYFIYVAWGESRELRRETKRSLKLQQLMAAKGV